MRISDWSSDVCSSDLSVISPRTWRLADLGAKHALLREGIGWANMPLQLIESDLVSGTLVRLAMADHPGGTYRFAGIWRRDRPPGPSASCRLAHFVELGPTGVAEPGLSNIVRVAPPCVRQRTRHPNSWDPS